MLRRNLTAICFAVALLAGGAILGQTSATPNCGKLPDDFVLQSGERLRLNERSYEVVLRREGEATEAAAWAKVRTSIELFALQLDRRDRSPILGSWESGLTASFRLMDGREQIAQGDLAFGLTERGSGWLGSAELPAAMAGRELRLELELRGNRELPSAACYPLNLPLEFRWDRLEAAKVAAGPVNRDPALNQRALLLGQLNPRPSVTDNDIWGYSDGTTHLAILGSFNGTVFIDVTDPTQPTEVGFIGGPGSSWRDIKTYLNYAYIVTEGSGTGQGVQIVDLSDPLNPTLVNTYATNFATVHNIWIDTERGIAWLVGTNQGARILDLTNPVSPVEIGSWSVRYVHDAFVDGEFAYFSQVFAGIHQVLDATNLPNLTVRSTFTTPDAFTHNSWPSNDRNLLATTDERTGGHLTVYDISNKDIVPPLLSEYIPDETSIVHNVFFDDTVRDRVAMSHYGLGIKYVDVGRPTQPVELLSFDTYPAGEADFFGAWGVYPFDPRGYFYVSDRQTGLYVIEYQPDGVVLTGKVSSAANGQPIAGASVVVLGSGQELTTEADGEFGEMVQTTSVVALVNAAGYQSRILDLGSADLDEGIDAEIELDPLPTVSVSGTVTNSADGQPVAGAVVQVVGSAISTTSDGSGNWTLIGVPVGQRTFAAEASGFAGTDARLTLGAVGATGVSLPITPAAFTDEMEIDDNGWFAERGTAIDGAWARIDPNPTGGGLVQPEDDHTPNGTLAWITGQAFLSGNIEFGDVDGGTTLLTSPTIDLTAIQNPAVGYYRWFSTSANDLDGGTMRVSVSPDAGGSWVDVELLSTDANAWTQVAVDIGDYIPITDQFQVRFACEAIPGFDNTRTLECGIDDVAILQECRSRVVPGGSDADFDGRLDGCDNCPNDAGNDADGDGVCGDLDNAPSVANADQLDQDNDGVGDVADNCPSDSNSLQVDTDGDGLGNVCDDDDDGDSILDEVDNDIDGDGIQNVADVCELVADAAQQDADFDGQGDACDTDDGRVNGLILDRAELRWNDEIGAGSYHVYRGLVGAAVLLPLAECRASDLPAARFVDNDLPEVGSGFFYLISAVSGGVENGVGEASDGTPRVIQGSCP